MLKSTILLLLSVISISIKAQTLLIQPNLGYSYHFDINEEDVLTGSSGPGIGFFFNNGFIYGGNVSFSFANMNEAERSFVMSLCYERSNFGAVPNAFDNTDIVMGETLKMNGYGFKLGFWLKPFSSNEFITNFSAGCLLKDYEGQNDSPNGESTRIKYSKSWVGRLGAGFTFLSSENLPVCVGLEVCYDIGSVEREFVEVYRNEKYAGNLPDVEDRTFSNNILSIRFDISYMINF